ncbi:hypothetical protein BRADI_1g70255v3 [Brachypodium distachyon]|uniref:Uncharacterized protein n=1 Tax=Brachypodium distachyon TaxID=15368 RepID=A0A0Q3LIG4_BRADI|nr:hypothetical protein BRADI_1g70255v3 [Brachypodium distachyon]
MGLPREPLLSYYPIAHALSPLPPSSRSHLSAAHNPCRRPASLRRPLAPLAVPPFPSALARCLQRATLPVYMRPSLAAPPPFPKSPPPPSISSTPRRRLPRRQNNVAASCLRPLPHRPASTAAPRRLAAPNGRRAASSSRRRRPHLLSPRAQPTAAAGGARRPCTRTGGSRWPTKKMS